MASDLRGWYDIITYPLWNITRFVEGFVEKSEGFKYLILNRVCNFKWTYLT